MDHQSDSELDEFEFPDDFILGSMAKAVVYWGKDNEHRHAPEANIFFWPNGWVYNQCMTCSPPT